MLNIENLRKIYNFIDALPDERVDMANWRTNAPELYFSDYCVDLNVCGTSACVVGWLPVIFNEELDGDFWYDQFSDKVGCTVGEATEVCIACRSGNYEIDEDGDEVEILRTKQDALESMRELAIKYGHVI